MTDGNVNEHLRHHSTVVEGHSETIADRALGWIVVIKGNLSVLNAIHLITKGINSRVSGNVILIILSSQTTMDQRNSNLSSATDAKATTMYWTQ